MRSIQRRRWDPPQPSNIYLSTNLTEIPEFSIGIESIEENLEAKRSLLQQISEAGSSDALLATTTSSFSLGLLAGDSKWADRFVALHFLLPVHSSRLVEVACDEAADRRQLEKAVSFISSLKKEAVVVPPTAGFVCNRLLAPYLFEAASLIAEGTLSPTQVDRIMTLGCSMPIGPLALIDAIGVDVCLSTFKNLLPECKENSKTAALLLAMVMDGKLGRKSGGGFYRYE